MRSMDALSFCLSVLGIYGLILYLRYLLPRSAISLLSALLNETRQLLDHAEAIGAVPPQSEGRVRLDCSADRFAAMRMDSNRARGAFQQLRLALLRGLTCKLYSLYNKIEDVKSELELVLDRRQLAITKSTTSPAVPGPTTVLPVTATPVSSVIEMTLPLPATTS